MCLLNGDMGGLFTSSKILDSREEFIGVIGNGDPNSNAGLPKDTPYYDSNGQKYYTWSSTEEKWIEAKLEDVTTIKKYPIQEMILSLLRLVGGEQKEKIIIEDLEESGLSLLEYTGS